MKSKGRMAIKMINTFYARLCKKELKLHNLIVLNWKKFRCAYGFFVWWWWYLFKIAMYKFMPFSLSLSIYLVYAEEYTKQSVAVVLVVTLAAASAVVYMCFFFFFLLVLLMLSMMTQYTVVNIVTLAYFVYRLCDVRSLVFIPHTRITIVHNNKNELYYVHKRMNTQQCGCPMPI